MSPGLRVGERLVVTDGVHAVSFVAIVPDMSLTATEPQTVQPGSRLHRQVHLGAGMWHVLWRGDIRGMRWWCSKSCVGADRRRGSVLWHVGTV